ncbi:prepilin-type N-terminal cleavage/methylation domain-containing protein [Fervidicella metallireducens]|nr:prepilin-type N-terminal cleavage/methylation domain-containing protein [Fervidicella metallireducens]
MKKNEKKRKKGFTLVELIVVIAILGILAAVTVPRFTGYQDKAKSTQTLVNAKQIATAIDSLIAEGKTVDEASIRSLSGVSGGTLTLDNNVGTNGFFTFDEGGYRAVRNTQNSGVTITGKTPTSGL